LVQLLAGTGFFLNLHIALTYLALAIAGLSATVLLYLAFNFFRRV
jgi:hypothetical protein